MRVGPGIAIKLFLFAALVCLLPALALDSAPAAQAASESGALLIDAHLLKPALAGAPLEIRVSSSEQRVNLAVTVEALSTARFDDLAPAEYLIEVTAPGFGPAQTTATLEPGQTVTFVLRLNPFSRNLELRIEPPPLSFSDLPRTNQQTSRKDSTVASTRPADAAEPSSRPAAAANSCPLNDILPRASKHLEEFVENVNRISAIEVLQHERLSKGGRVLERERRQFNYVAIIEETEPGALNVDEYRDGIVGANGGFPHDIATVGMPSLAMIFHPSHLSEFEMVCEGPQVWHDRSAWRVHFRQRKDRPARMSSLRYARRLFSVLLKGSAWIDAENYQIVHLETDLLEPLLEAKLYTEHQSLDYGPVQFADRQTQMWLPQQAEIYLDSAGRRFHHLHTYSQYRIFSVQVGQKIGVPK